MVTTSSVSGINHRMHHGSLRSNSAGTQVVTIGETARNNDGINRACFYHLVYTGRGSELIEEDLSHEETRW